ncbi:hypothetical protein DFJ74DRAFT_683204 [Hyaloraphidium curvatum]|nr:hypothetical protein DFJ74DRAFT_698159 [Hyaloraphidium curvatum]KAI9012286.1 hypothetical protein DFJ74DRAFT_683204 [Hyaloraphidium curvatum]
MRASLATLVALCLAATETFAMPLVDTPASPHGASLGSFSRHRRTSYPNEKKCMYSCSDAAFFFGTFQFYQLGCAGSKGQCTFFLDDACTRPRPRTVEPTGTIACPYDPTDGWCKTVHDVYILGYPAPTTCTGNLDGGGIPLPNPNCPSDHVSYPRLPVDTRPYATCVAPKDGPSYPGSSWGCLQDESGKDAWTPVKRTQYGQIGCMATNSWDCIWVPKSCCEKLAASGTDKSPYFECGALHYRIWKTSGYSDPNHWCSRGWKLLNPDVPVPTPGC